MCCDVLILPGKYNYEETEHVYSCSCIVVLKDLDCRWQGLMGNTRKACRKQSRVFPHKPVGCGTLNTSKSSFVMCMLICFDRHPTI